MAISLGLQYWRAAVSSQLRHESACRQSRGMGSKGAVTTMGISCSRYGPELSASPTTLWDKSCSRNIWELYPFGRRKKENRRQEGAYKITTRDICMYVRWIRAHIPICLPVCVCVCVSLHGCDFLLYKLTSFHGSSADKQSCIHVALWRSRQFSSLSVQCILMPAFWFPFFLPESPYDSSSDKGQCDRLRCGQWNLLLFHLQQLHANYFRIVFWFLRLGSWAWSSLAHPLATWLSYWVKGMLPCPSSCTIFLTELIHFRMWWNVSLSTTSFSNSSCGLKGVSSHLTWPFAFSYRGISGQSPLKVSQGWVQEKAEAGYLASQSGGCLMLMPLGLEISPLVKSLCSCLLHSTGPLPNGVFQKTQGKEAKTSHDRILDIMWQYFHYVLLTVKPRSCRLIHPFLEASPHGLRAVTYRRSGSSLCRLAARHPLKSSSHASTGEVELQ